MTVKDLVALFDYTYWAKDRLLEALAQVTPQQFTQPVAGSYGSLRNTLVHILSEEWGWLELCGGSARGADLHPTDYPTLASVADRWHQVESHVRGFLATLRDEDLGRAVKLTLGGGPSQTLPLRALMHHAAVHGIHHRGQVSLLLRALGYTPGNFDILLYYARPSAMAAR